MARDLVIIESPGKLRTLYRVFAAVGLYADICATFGHFLENPPALNDLGIEYRDGEFVETKRRPHRLDCFAYLKDRLLKCQGRVLIATDDDQEGHVIAQDVVNLARSLGVRRPIFRMTFAGLDVASVREALQHLTPVSPDKAIPGTARRITDRIIGGCLTDFRNDRPVGRVQSALLGLAAAGIAHSSVYLRMPAADGGPPFVGALPVAGPITPAELIAQLDAERLPPAHVAASTVTALRQGLNFGDALIEMNGALGLDIEQAAELLQTMYEAGYITYPRTRARAFTAAGVDAIERLAAAKGLRGFRREYVTVVQKGSPHEALRILDEALYQRLDLGKPARLQPTARDAALVLIARRSLESGIAVRRDFPDLRSAPQWARAIDWHRDLRDSILPWPALQEKSVVQHDRKVALLRAMMEAGIGRPSTWVAHAAKLASRRPFLDSRLCLTPKGREVLTYTPPSLRDAGICASVEKLLDREDIPVSELVVQALRQALGADGDAVAKILEQLDAKTNDAADELVMRLRM